MDNSKFRQTGDRLAGKLYKRHTLLTGTSLAIICALACIVHNCHCPVAAAPNSQRVPTRQVTFPTKFSSGYLYTVNILEGSPLPLAADVKNNGTYLGVAQGKVTVPAAKQARIYLFASYQLLENPKELETMDPNCVDVFVLSPTYLFQSVEESMPHIAHLTGLKGLDLTGAELSDQAIMPFKAVTNLEELAVGHTGAKGTFLKDFSAMTKLRDLDLSFNPLAPAVIGYLARIPSLKKLNLARCGVDDAGLIELCKLPRLEELIICQSPITGKGISALNSMKTLKRLDLTGCKITINDLLALKMPELARLKLSEGTYLTKDIKALKKNLPAAQVVITGHVVPQDTKEIFAPLH
jgi:Leucine-rich repeat (LRR) protein